jgi:MFS family permease
MVYSGSIGLVFSIMMISLCHTFWQFLLAQGVLLGISMALATWPMIALVGQYFKRSRAAATGFVVAGSSLGGIVWPIMIDRLLNTTSIGFPWTMRIIGFVMIPFLIFSCVAAKSPVAPVVQPKDLEAPEEKSDIQLSTTEKDPKLERNAARKALYMLPSMQLTCLAMFITYFGVFAPIFYLPSFATEQGFSTTLAFYTASIVNGASFVGRIIPGFVADKYGKFNCCIIAMISSGVVILCWTKVTSVAGLVIWSAAYGFASGVSSVSLFRISQHSNSTRRASSLFSKLAPLSLPLLPQSALQSEALLVPRPCRKYTLLPDSLDLTNHDCSAMANVPISGALAEKYGYLSISIFSGVTVLAGGVLLIAARLVQNREWRAVV